jgi:hypothetical protein
VKNSPKMYPNPFFRETNAYILYTVFKSSTNFYSFGNFQNKLSKVNNRPIDENSPNLATLLVEGKLSKALSNIFCHCCNTWSSSHWRRQFILRRIGHFWAEYRSDGKHSKDIGKFAPLLPYTYKTQLQGPNQSFDICTMYISQWIRK